MAHDVFISYSTKDKTIADAVCAKLEEYKIRVWIAPRDVPAGSKFAESIIRAINTCKVFVLIWSANTNASDHILNEINQAFDQGITIIPFRIQDIQPTDEMRYYFGRTHWLDAITPPLENHIAILRDTILVNLGRELQPAKPASYPQETSGEAIQPSIMPITEKEPAIEPAEAVRHPLISPSKKKSQKIDEEIQPTVAAPANLTRFIPFAAGGLVVLTLVILLLSGVFKGSTPEDVAQTSRASTSSIPQTSPSKPTSTIKPTETPTPIPAWMDEAIAVAEPILAAIEKFQPDFQDDFSQVDPHWMYGSDDAAQCSDASDTQMSITDGSMKYSIINCQVGYLHYTDMHYGNYVLQLDVNFREAPLGLEFRNWGTSLLGEDVQLDYHIHHDASWGFGVFGNGDFIEGIDGNYGLDFSKPVTITIINISPNFIVYVDSALLTFYSTQEKYEGFGLDFTVNSWDVTPTETLTLELDNIKIWDLDRIEEVNAMGELILAKIHNFPSDFADDFSQVDPNWIYGPDDPGQCPDASDVKMSITEGSMKYSIINCQVGNLHYTDMHYGNYVLQLDVNFQGAPLGLEFRNWGRSQDEDVQLDYHIHHDASWGFGVFGNGDFIEGMDGNYGLDFSKPLTITIINQSPTFIVYVDSSLLTFYSTQEEYEGFGMDFTVNSWDVTPTEMTTLELDNIKIWDLDKIEQSIAVSDSIMAAVQDLPPDFEDDFSQVDPNWINPPGTESPECINAGDAAMSITDGSMKYSIINCQQGSLQYQGMRYGNYVLKLDANFQGAPLGLTFRNWGQSINLAFALESPEGIMHFSVSGSEDLYEESRGNYGLDFSKPFTITIINKSPTFIVYVDSSLLTLYNTQEAYAGPFELDFAVNSWDVTPTETITLELDNIKIWDLDKIEY
jgi:hypothetical protein